MSFAAIPIRENGSAITYSWFNDLRTAGSAIEAAFGSAFISETQATLSNNQTSQNITGLLFNGSAVRAATIEYSIRRASSDAEYIESGRILANYGSAGWSIAKDNLGDAETTITITAAGQLQYTTTNMSGSAYSGKMRFMARTIGVET